MKIIKLPISKDLHPTYQFLHRKTPRPLSTPLSQSLDNDVVKLKQLQRTNLSSPFFFYDQHCFYYPSQFNNAKPPIT